MSDPLLDALAESARNRGLKLVRSRVRTPGKGDFGKVGLADSRGKPVFGFDGDRLAASPDQAEDYLRNLNASDWGASLDLPVAPRKQRKTTATNKGPPAPPPPPPPAVRTARPGDVEALVPLMALLGHKATEEGIRKRLSALAKAGDAQLVATIGDRVVGLCGVQVSTMIQRERPVGRITFLAVAEDVRGQSLGRMLVEAAEAHFRKAGCGLIEVTSRDEHVKAHAFYRHLGYERTSMRFAKEF
ncbi:MAG: GNAT family N-acetyltransferase [Sphingomicrobium sp.]